MSAGGRLDKPWRDITSKITISGIILDVLKRKNYDSYDFHSLVMDVKKIFEKRNAKQALDILLYIYSKNRCSACTTDIVRIMCRNKVIPKKILEEALYEKETLKNYCRQSYLS